MTKIFHKIPGFNGSLMWQETSPKDADLLLEDIDDLKERHLLKKVLGVGVLAVGLVAFQSLIRGEGDIATQTFNIVVAAGCLAVSQRMASEVRDIETDIAVFNEVLSETRDQKIPTDFPAAA